jgi:XTP/dITP diphosphohydrolase
MSDSNAILLATNNAHKVEEIRAVLQAEGVAVQSLEEAGIDAPEPVEDQPTFAGNAWIKARHYAILSGRPCLADDSGLCVDALGGEPGVRSARFAGVTGRRADVDAANNRQLIDSLTDVPEADRTAKFVCVMVLVDPQTTWAQVRGEVRGRIINPSRGSHGFGYDPHFEVAGLGRTAAELAPEQKNAISHRGKALGQLALVLRRLDGQPVG